MNVEERRGLWKSLGLIEDWLSEGIRNDRIEPVFPQDGDPSLATEADSLEQIALEVRECQRCRLGDTRKKAVPGQGVESPLVMVIGEGPGAEEDNQGLPFVGPAGKLLDKMLAAVGLARDRNCFIANVVKCRPPGNRDPAPDEEEACSVYLRRQIALLQPHALLCVGRIAAQSLLGTKQGINALRGRWLRFEGLPLIATFHPSALLRDETLKRPAWEDLKKLREFLVESGALGGHAGGHAGGESDTRSVDG